MQWDETELKVVLSCIEEHDIDNRGGQEEDIEIEPIAKDRLKEEGISPPRSYFPQRQDEDDCLESYQEDIGYPTLVGAASNETPRKVGATRACGVNSGPCGYCNEIA